jgi:hypothetical protein
MVDRFISVVLAVEIVAQYVANLAMANRISAETMS